jgi:ActD protein
MADKPGDLVAVVDTRQEAVELIEALTGAGVSRDAINVMSSEPLHLESGDDARTRISGWSIAGGLVGTATALLLTIWTSRRVGLITGGMPVISPWAFGVIVFELTALGGILATLGRMIYEADLWRRGRRRMAPEAASAVADDRVALLVRPDETTDVQVIATLMQKYSKSRSTP